MFKSDSRRNIKYLIAVVFIVLLQAGCSETSEPGGSQSPTTVEPENTNAIVDPVNTPDVVGGTSYYPDPVNTTLLTGPLIGTNAVSGDSAATPVAFSQLSSDEPLRIQRVVVSNNSNRNDSEHELIVTIKNITSELVCGTSLSFTYILNDGSTVRVLDNSTNRIRASWHGKKVNSVYQSSIQTIGSTIDSCIEPNSSIYFVTDVDGGVTPDTLASIEFTNLSVFFIGTDGDETVTILPPDIIFIPTGYTIGLLPDSDTRVQTGAADEFVKVSVVNNSSFPIRTNTAWMLPMDSNGFPVARFRNERAVFALQTVEPGEEFEFIFRNDFDAGEISSIRVIVEAGEG